MEDHSYLKICAQLASALSISLASARRKVDLLASKKGVKDLVGRKDLAATLLSEANTLDKNQENRPAMNLDRLLEALAEDENFMVED